MKSKLVLGFLLGISLTQFGHAIDRTDFSGKVLYRAIDQLAEYMEKDLDQVSKHTKKTSIVNYTQSEELPTSIQHYLVKRLEYVASKNTRTPVKFVRCLECLSMQAVAEGDEIFIRKGITNDKQLKKTLSNLGIRKYTDINLAYTGDKLVMQLNVVDENKLVDWSGEYKTPYKAHENSQWLINIGAEVGSYSDNDIPSAKGARVSVGQRLTGFGAIGLSTSFFEEAPGIPQVVSLGTFASFSHNEIFNQYWDFARLYYQAELGVTDFNGSQLFHETIGVKGVMGIYSLGINIKLHQFVSTPDDDSPINNTDGKSFLNNNDPLPMLVSLGLGVEIM